MEEIYTTKQVAEMLKVTVDTVKIWLKNGRLNGTKVGKSWRITSQEVRSLMINLSIVDNYIKGLPDEPQPQAHTKQIRLINNHRANYDDDLMIRFPYPYNDGEVVSYDINGNPQLGSDKEVYNNYYLTKLQEESKKLEKLMEIIARKYGVRNEDINEAMRTVDNLQILALAGTRK